VKTSALVRMALLGACLALVSGCATHETPSPSATIVATAAAAPVPLPRFVLTSTAKTALKRTDGHPFGIAAWRENSPLVLCFFTSDCHDCADELLQLVRLHDAYARQGLKIVMVSPEPLPRLKKFAADHHVPFPVLCDSARGFREAYGGLASPFAMLVNREGKVVQALSALADVSRLYAMFGPDVERELRSAS